MLGAADVEETLFISSQFEPRNGMKQISVLAVNKDLQEGQTTTMRPKLHLTFPKAT